MAFFIKNTSGPSRVGGFFPQSDEPVRCINRSGSAVALGQVVQLDLAASAAEITTNDSNSYLPGAGDASDDSVWETVVDPATITITNGGTWFGVCLDVSVADNAVGSFQFFGVVEEAFVVRAGTNSTVPGAGLTVVAGATATFDGVIGTTERAVATYIDAEDSSLTNAELKRVFLHNGIFGGGVGAATT